MTSATQPTTCAETEQQQARPLRDAEGFTLPERVKLFSDAYGAVIDHPANSEGVRKFLESVLDEFVEAAETTLGGLQSSRNPSRPTSD